MYHVCNYTKKRVITDIPPLKYIHRVLWWGTLEIRAWNLRLRLDIGDATTGPRAVCVQINPARKIPGGYHMKVTGSRCRDKTLYTYQAMHECFATIPMPGKPHSVAHYIKYRPCSVENIVATVSVDPSRVVRFTTLAREWKDRARWTFLKFPHIFLFDRSPDGTGATANLSERCLLNLAGLKSLAQISPILSFVNTCFAIADPGRGSRCTHGAVRYAVGDYSYDRRRQLNYVPRGMPGSRLFNISSIKRPKRRLRELMRDHGSLQPQSYASLDFYMREVATYVRMYGQTGLAMHFRI